MTHDIDIVNRKAKAVFTALIEECNFMDYLTGAQDFFEWENKNYESVVDHCGLTISTGCTRAVVYSEDYKDYVFKFQYADEADANGEIIDYNANELYIYNKAKEAGVEDAFAWIDKVFTFDVNGSKLDIYAMEYCDCGGWGTSPASDSYVYHFKRVAEDLGYNADDLSDAEDEEVTSALYEEGETDEPEMMMWFAGSIWGQDYANKIDNFLDTYCVNDTHGGNWGYTTSHKLVLTDYAGYRRNLRSAI